MKKFELFRYLKKWMFLIIAFFGVMTVLAFQTLEKRQRYMASSVVEFTNESASEGYAPDGSEIDVSEIYSSSNMTKVMDNLGLSQDDYSLDTLCAGITVTPIIEEQDKNIQDAVNEEGEEYTFFPTVYIVSCTLDNHGSEGQARNILNELLDVYFSDYSNKHINQDQVTNQTKNLIQTDYDYLEMVEAIDAQLAETIDSLHVRYMRAQGFRSIDTGYSFADLRDQFTLLRDIDISRLYSLILGNQITKDKDLLINKYQNRIANYGLNAGKSQEDMGDSLQVIESYVSKMRQSGNTDINFEYILSDVYEHDWMRDEEGNYQLPDRTVQYDTLLRSWVDSCNSRDYAKINSDYCTYVIGVYRDGITGLSETRTINNDSPQAESADLSENVDSAEPVPLQEETVSIVDQVPKSDRKISAEEVNAEIGDVISRMNELYDIVTKTNSEYNEYLGAANIKILSSASVQKAFNMRLYKIVIAFFFLVVGCCGAVVLGRLGDILEYLFLKDNMTGCMNRVSCDSYIQKHENLLLPLNTCCVNLQITNQRDLNSMYGREGADQILKEFGRILREIFGNRKNSFIAYNGGGQFLAFFEKLEQETIHNEADRLVVILSQTLSEYSVSYQMGAVNVGEEASFKIRELLTNAAKARKRYRTEKEDKTEKEDETR